MRLVLDLTKASQPYLSLSNKQVLQAAVLKNTQPGAKTQRRSKERLVVWNNEVECFELHSCLDP
jgi:hypothetical protein